MPVEPPTIEIDVDHEATVGGVLVRRALPRRARRTVGAWCFLDHFGPESIPPGEGLNVMTAGAA